MRPLHLRLSSIEATIASISKYFFWISIFFILFVLLFNVYAFAIKGASEITVAQKLFIFLAFFFWLATYVTLLNVGLIKLRGSAAAVDGNEAAHAVLFVALAGVPTGWIVLRGVVATRFGISPLELDYIGGWSALCLTFVLFLNMVSFIVRPRSIIEEHSLSSSVQSIIEWLFGGPSTGIALFSLIKFHWKVFVEAWLPPGDVGNTILRLNQAVSPIRTLRSRVYSDPTLLPIFQETCLSRFHEPQALAASQRIQAWTASRAQALPPSIRILDIGGGEGVATRNFLLQLSMNLASCSLRPRFEIDLFETKEMAQQYVETVASCPQFSVVVHEQGVFTPQTPLPLEQMGTYDLILALHSLYSTFDSAQKSLRFRDDLSRLKGDLLSYLNPGGIMALSLASRFGESAEFKRLCLLEAFGRAIQDATADQIREVWRPEDEAIITDTFFYFTTDEDGQVNREALRMWIRYFARITAEWAPRLHQDYLVDHLISCCRPFSNLPEASQKELLDQKVATEEILLRSRFLSHKTMLLLYCKS